MHVNTLNNIASVDSAQIRFFTYNAPVCTFSGEGAFFVALTIQNIRSSGSYKN